MSSPSAPTSMLFPKDTDPPKRSLFAGNGFPIVNCGVPDVSNRYTAPALVPAVSSPVAPISTSVFNKETERPKKSPATGVIFPYVCNWVPDASKR